ncbi:SusC/RagA family TonB-linked outer membrane protein [Niastella caeni]|uniref:SusC/RagA family TonB-linked outer membrane protein n=1 Tax=Niastella caeni TaxID=2569763 RepID=A0A4S8HL17_9BACT|nr:SusC/RagA family TonB-linked outer membrane protein [Niastella caeni]THU35845.1 SusC/RagA family TonB-linked outer membrane protein [Niastella caeni]
MKKHYKILLVLSTMLCCCIVSMAQSTIVINTRGTVESDAGVVDTVVDLGFRKEPQWRNTGAVYTLRGRELSKMFTGNLLNTLQGRIPGLTVVTGSGEPGYDNPSLYVRGQTSWNIGGNQLVILLDGFQVETGALSALSPYEIESVTLLKDAVVTARFGLQGGAGVLSVRTKKGKAMPKNELVLNARYGISSAVQLPGVMNAYDYATLYNQALVNDGFSPKYPNPDLYKAANDPFHPNVNWYNELLNNRSYMQDYNLSFRGGNQTARYFVMVDYMNENGLYKNAKAINKDFGTNATYNKINLRANAEIDLTKDLLVSATVSGIIEDRNTPSGFSASQLFNNLMTIPAAAFPVKNPNGTWGNSSVYNFNPVELLQQSGIYSAHTRTLQTGVTVKQKLDIITPGLNITGGVSFNNQYGGFYMTSYAVRTYEIVKNAQDLPVRDADSNVVYKTIGNDVPRSTGDGGTFHWNRNTLQLGFDYNRSFGKHTFSATVLGRRVSYLHNGQTYAVRVQGLSTGVTYDYAQKYIVDLSGAYMGSADFAPGKRYGFFPAVGIGWVASNEGLLKSSRVVDYLKFRASYGSAGNINESYRFLYTEQANGASGWITGSGNTLQSGMAIAQLANPNATWELKTSFNVGFDIRLLKTLSASVDVFSEKRTGIYEIPAASVPAFTGFNLPWVNSGVVHNKGFEAVINYDNKAGDCKYHISGSAAFARNKIMERSETAQPFDRLYQKGFAVNQEKGLAFDGFYQQTDFDANGNLKAGVVASSFTNVKPGDLKYKDLDDNGVINGYDIQPFGYSSVPEITLGLNIGFAWKGIDLSAFAQGVLHRTVNLLTVAYNYTHPFVNNNNITAFSNNSFTPATALTATTPRLSTLSNPNNDQSSNFWLRKGGFIKLRSVQLGYTFSKKGFLKKAGGVRVFVNGTNLFVFNRIDGLEPENLSMGYPLTKVVDFGFNIKF